MTTLDDLLAEQAKITEKINRERAIISFIKVASNAVGHRLVFRRKANPDFVKTYDIISSTTCRWIYGDESTSLEVTIRDWFEDSTLNTASIESYV